MKKLSLIPLLSIIQPTGFSQTTMKRKLPISIIFAFLSTLSWNASSQVIVKVKTLAELRVAVTNSNQNIILTPGNYKITDLASNERYFDCTGSNNTINLSGVYINFPVNSTNDQHFLITGSNNILRGGVFENTYPDGTTDITDYVAYNNDKNNFANGASPHLVIQGDGNKVVGIKMTVRGSFPYGYGSIYGINADNQFGVTKRGGIAVQGRNAIIDSCELQMRAFGHGIYIQSPSNHTIIRNTIVIGDLRLGSTLLAETDPSSLPYKSGYLDFSEDSQNPTPIDPTRGISLCEDGIRLYADGGSMDVTNCRVEKMRGGIRGYLGSGTTVTNSIALDCESTNFNLPTGGSIANSSGNFAYCPLSDYRLNKSNTTVELTIIPSPNASGPHDILDINGNSHNITLHRTTGPLDTDEARVIVITGNNSTIINETEYTIIIQAGASGNKITSCGPVIDNGSKNTITRRTDCVFDLGTPICVKTVAKTEAECYDDMFGVVKETCSEGGEDLGSIGNNDWVKYTGLDLSNVYSFNARVASNNVAGGNIEVRLASITGTLLATLPVSKTASWQTYETKSINLNYVNGVNDVFLVFKGGAGSLMNLNWFGFSDQVICNNTAARIEAECYTSMLGIQTEKCTEGTKNVGYINDGDWLAYTGINLTGMKSVNVRYANNKATGVTMEIRTGSATGTLIATIPMSSTGGNQLWESKEVSLSSVTGTQNVYLVFKGGTGYLMNLNWLEFSNKIVTGFENSSEEYTNVSIYPNPSTTEITIQNAAGTRFEILNASGETVLKGISESDSQNVDLSGITSGIYFIKTIDNLKGNSVFKIIKQ